MEKPNYYAIIPADVRYADIPANAKLLFGEITALASKEGFCWASNQYFAKLFGVHKDAVSSWVAILKDKGFIYTNVKNRNERAITISSRIGKITYGDRSKDLGGDRSKDRHNNTSNNNTNNTSNAEALPVNEVIDLFKEINPTYKRLFANKTERAATERMIKEVGVDNLIKLIKALPAINGKQYWPISTTPCELERNLGKYKAKFNQLKTKKAEDKNKVAVI